MGKNLFHLFRPFRLELFRRAEDGPLTEGRSLRLINKHWSAAVTDQVEEIRPDTTRSIVDEDIASLSKFKWLTSVDISPFLIPPPKHVMPKNRKQKVLFRQNWYDTKLGRIVHLLCDMPKLTQIEIGLKTIISLYFHCPRTREYFSLLERITSVYLYICENRRLYGKTRVNTTWTALSDYDPDLDLSNMLAQLVCSLGRLDTLEVESLVLDCCSQFGFLDQVRHVTLQGASSRMPTQLSNLSTSITSVVLFFSPESRWDTLGKLTRLDGLSLMGVGSDRFEELPLTPLSNKLKVLHIDGYCKLYEFAFLNDIKTTFNQLECLILEYTNLVGASLRRNFPNLNALRILDCMLMDSDVTFVAQFHKLELLDWHDVSSPQEESLHLPWEKLELPKLRSLSVCSVLDDSELLSISRQTNLEVLKIESCCRAKHTSSITNKGTHLLEDLCNLRIFCIIAYEKKERRLWSSLLSAKFVTKLEQLWVEFDEKDDEDDEDSLKRIACNSPDLILKASCWRYQSFHSACFI